MPNFSRTMQLILVVVTPMLVAGCGGGGGDSKVPGDNSIPDGYTIGGTISGLVAPTNPPLFLQNNLGDNLIVDKNGEFAFVTPLPEGATYGVTVLQQPKGQECTITNGSGTVAAAAVTSVSITCVDIVAPKLGATTPAADATAIRTSAVVTASFNEPVFAADGSITVTGGSNVTGSVTMDPTSKMATFTPASRLARLTTYTATVDPAGITDLAGNILESGRSWSFTTADGFWGSAALIEDGDGGAYSARVAVSNDGTAVAVWTQSDGSRYNVWANRYLPATGWSGASLIETNNSGSAYNPEVAVDASGNAIVVWQQADGSIHNIWSNRYVAGAGWQTPALLENANGYAQHPHLAMNGTGVAVAVWQQVDDVGGRSSIWARRYAGGSWSAAELIENDNLGDGVDARVAIDGSGNAIAIWRHSDPVPVVGPSDPIPPPPVNNIWTNRLSGTAWSGAMALESGSGEAAAPQVAFDVAGNAMAVWQQSDGIRHNIWARNYLAGGTWGTAVLIETDDSGDAQVPQVAFDGSGTAVAVWQQFDASSVNSVWSNRYQPGSGWGSAGLVEKSAAEATTPVVALEAGGRGMALWVQGDSIWSSRYRSDTGWGAPQVIEAAAGLAKSPQLVFDGSENAMAVWLQRKDAAVVKDSVYFNRFE